MRPNVTNNEVAFRQDDCLLTNTGKSSGGGPKSLACQLRALGQALEKFGFSVFDLEIKSGTYLVRANTTSAKGTSLSFARFVSEALERTPFTPAFVTTDHQSALRFSAEDIKQFDAHGKSRRQDSGKMSDPYTISQLLRSAGCYLDNRNIADRVSISLVGGSVMIRHQMVDRCKKQTRHHLKYFYDYWGKMYLRRGDRVKLVAPVNQRFW